MKVAAAVERFTANRAGHHGGPVLRGLVPHQRALRRVYLVAVIALETDLVQQQVIVEIIAGGELLRALRATVTAAAGLRCRHLVPPFVVRHVLHQFTADLAYMAGVHVDLLDVQAEVHFQFKTFAAMVAHVLRLDVAVHADLVMPQSSFAFVAQMTNGALQIEIVLVRFFMFNQSLPGRVNLFTFVAA